MTDWGNIMIIIIIIIIFFYHHSSFHSLPIYSLLPRYDEHLLFDQPWRHKDSKRGWHRRLPLIHPDSILRIAWQVAMAVPLLYVGTLLPFRIAFLDFRINLDAIDSSYRGDISPPMDIPNEKATDIWVRIFWGGNRIF